MNLSSVSKALAAAVAGVVVALLSRYGLNDKSVLDAVNVLITALVGAVLPFVVTYLSPRNK